MSNTGGTSALATGRLAALDDLYDLAAPSLYGLALWRTGSEEDAADVVQEVFVRVAEQGSRLAKVRNPKAWLLTVARRAAVDVTRRRSRRTADSLDDHPFLTAADDHGERLLDAAQVSVLLCALPESSREVIYLKHFAGCTFAEIGNIVAGKWLSTLAPGGAISFGMPNSGAASRDEVVLAGLRGVSLGAGHLLVGVTT